MKYLFVIPARGGSKGVLKKNIKPLNGVPLVFYSIDLARQFSEDQHICVSTDDLEIIDVIKDGRNLDIPFIRPNELATDTAGTHEVLLHAIQHFESKGLCYDAVVLLQPTSPLRTFENLKEAIALYQTNEVDMVVSVKVAKANPYFTLFEENEAGYLQQSKKSSFTRRQDCPQVYKYNGAIYVINIQSLKKSKMSEFARISKYVMKDEVSIDIDTPFDWKIAEMLMSN